MAGKGIAIAGLGIIAILIVVLVILPQLMVEDSLNFSAEVYGMKDGRRVTSPYAFIEQGVEIDALGCDASWTAAGTGVEWSTLVIIGEFRIYLQNSDGSYDDITPARLDFQRAGEPAKTGSEHFEIMLDTLLTGQSYTGWIVYREAEIRIPYWVLKITFDVTGSVDQDTSGVPGISDSLTDEANRVIEWKAGEFSLTGGIIP